MKGDKEVIKHFNVVLTNELTAINQYFLHSRMFKDWGYESLGKKEYEESIDEMKHADMIIERILFLNGIPNVQEMHKVMIGEEPIECLKCDFQIEIKAIPDLKNAIQHCEKVSDFFSRDIFRQILESEEEHYDWLETQIELSEKNWKGKLVTIPNVINYTFS
jgi:bacterioferritin